jgi:transcriptional regulator with XRE-family HTH domain
MTTHDLFTELRLAREARGMSLDDIAQSTLINIDFLKAIEAGNTGILPAAYVRAFLRAYANSVGLDPAYVMHRFEGKTGLPEPPPPPASVTPAATPDDEPEATPFLSRPGVRTWGVTAAVLLGVALIIYLTQPQAQQGGPGEVPIGTILRETEQRLMPKDTAAAAAVAVPRTGNSRDSLTLHAVVLDTVWIQIAIDANPPVDHLFPPGSRRQWRARDRFLVTLGNAGGVQFHLNARDLGALGKRGAVLRDVELTREALTSPVQTESRP